MTAAICGFITFIIYGIVAVFAALASALGIVLVLCIGAGILGILLYGGRTDDNIRPTENTREW